MRFVCLPESDSHFRHPAERRAIDQCVSLVTDPTPEHGRNTAYSTKKKADEMKKYRNDFTDQLIVLIAIIVPSLIGSWIGGGGGFLIGLVIAAPIALGVIRYVEGTFPMMKRSG